MGRAVPTLRIISSVAIWSLCLSICRGRDHTQPAQELSTAVSMERVLRFPTDASVGVVHVRDADLVIPETVKGFHPGYGYAPLETFAVARGEVRVPPGKHVILMIRGTGAYPHRVRAALESLGPHGLYGLGFFFWEPVRIPDDLMAAIGQLSGLRRLDLTRVRVTPKGLALVAELPRLEHLYTPANTTDALMAEVARMRSLQRLDVPPSRLTDEGLRSLGKIVTLESLTLYGAPGMTDDGLAALTQLRRLRHVRLGREGPFTGRGMAHLAALPSLRVLWLDTPRVDDEGLRQLSESPSLERLCVHWLDRITGCGVSHLKKMPRLRALDVAHAQLTDADLRHLKEIPTLEYLHLPNVFTDAGISHLGALDRLRYLWVNCCSSSPLTDQTLKTISTLPELRELHIASRGFTEEGLEALLGLPHLEVLSLAWFGPNGMNNRDLERLATMSKLRKLSLGLPSELTMSGLSALNEMSGLEILTLREVHQDDRGLDLSGLKQLKSLRIDLSRQTSAGGTFAQQIPDPLGSTGQRLLRSRGEYRDSDLTGLSGLAGLEDLSLTGPGIGNAGLAHLSPLTNLKRLQLEGGPKLTDVGLQHLARMQRLDTLGIYDSRISGPGLASLHPLKTLHVVRIRSEVPVSRHAVARLKTELSHLRTLEVSPSQKGRWGVSARRRR